MRTSFADYFICKSATKMVLNCLGLRSTFDCRLKSVHEHVEIFLNVHLLNNIDWLTLPVFKRMAIRFRIDIHLFRQQKTSKKGLPLQEHIVFIWIFVMIRIFYGKDIVPETWNHKKLLVETIHVADATEVFYSNMASC